MTSSQGPTGASATPGPLAEVTATLTGQDAAVRLVDLVSGQRLQGTVVRVLGDGQVMLGLLGGQVLAHTNMSLSAGRSYDFTVTQTGSRIVLTADRPLVLPTQAGAARAGLLGSGPELVQPLMQVLRQLPPTSSSEPQPAREGSGFLGQFQRRLAGGVVTGRDLAELHQRFGHDQEARVMRLPPAATGPAPAATGATGQEVAQLQNTMKADLLRFLVGSGAEDSNPRPDLQAAVTRLLEGFARMEADNAHRADQGAPQWLPLPVAEGSFLRDARMFLLRDAAEDGDADDARSDSKGVPFTVVLLLDLTNLGQVRVDVEVRGETIGVTFRFTDSSSLHLINSSKEELAKGLADQGLDVSFIRVQTAPGDGDSLPVADLLTPPWAGGESETRVDVHA